MRILEKTARFGAIALAVLFIGLSLCGIFGAWFVSRTASDVALKMFGVIEIGVGVVDAGVGRVDDLIATSRTEVRQAGETITAVGGQAVANSPVLTALNERLETNLAPRIAQMQQALAPVRDAVGNVSNAVSMVSSLPMMAERAPRLAALDESLNRLEGLSADATQLRSTLRALVAEQKSGVTPETIAALNGLTQRIDTRLGEVQANVQEVRAEVEGVAGPAGQAKVAAALPIQPGWRCYRRYCWPGSFTRRSSLSSITGRVCDATSTHNTDSRCGGAVALSVRTIKKHAQTGAQPDESVSPP